MAYLLFPLSAFVSAFLLFAIQPAVGKMLLPAFGGGALVWGTCMIGFQALLLLGYLLAHLLLRRAPLRVYSWAHPVLLLGAVAQVWTAPPRLVTELPAHSPFVEILLFLAKTISLPFLLLSFSTPLLQRGLAASNLPRRREAHRIFSASNVGSFAALLAYPFALEPAWDLNLQVSAWTLGLAALAMLYIAIAFIARPGAANVPIEEAAPSTPDRPFLWPVFLLSAGGSALLLAITNILTYETASVPQLWVLPLSLYLLTFVIAFGSKGAGLVWLHRTAGWLVGLSLVLYLLNERQLLLSTGLFLFVHLVVVFFGCLYAHGRVARLMPSDPVAVTRFNVALSAGGLAGSAAAVILAPVLANSLVEYPWALLLIVVGVWVSKRDFPRDWRLARWGLAIGLAVIIAISWGASAASLPAGPLFGILAFGALFTCVLRRRSPAWLTGAVLGVWLGAVLSRHVGANHVERAWRGHYGIYKLVESGGKRTLNHGSTTHGAQYLDPAKRHLALTYYHADGPAGEILARETGQPRVIGMIGLGAGALLAYGKSGDVYHVYELDPLNVRLAEEKFTFLSDARARGVKIEIKTGDGRLNLRSVPDGAYDFLAVDAFSGDSIPIHLLTVEAMREYERVTKCPGLVLLHVSNRLLTLEPVVTSNLAEMHRLPYYKEAVGSEDRDLMSCVWMFHGKDQAHLAKLSDEFRWSRYAPAKGRLPRAWTDQHSNLLPVIAGLGW